MKNHRKKTNDSFFERVYEVVELIPEGRISTYGAIARYLGSPGAARMVGWAMNACHTANFPVPAHRIVNRNGVLTGKNHFRHPDLMRELLESEGIEIEHNQVKYVFKHMWDPCQELV